jgi:peptidoglycan hydrolase CwlO-like protein
MEILNKNQRSSAIWRLVALGVVVVGAFVAISFAMHQEYAGQGIAEWQKLEEDYLSQIQILKGQRQDAVNKNLDLEEKIKALENKLAKPDGRVSLLEERIKLLDEEIKKYERDIKRLERDLAECKTTARN